MPFCIRARLGVALLIVIVLLPMAPVSAHDSAVTASPAPRLQSCGDAPRPRLDDGDRAYVLPGPPNNLRQDPGLSGRRIGEIPQYGEFEVLDGPTCRDNYYWWKVNYKGKVGWTAEGERNTYWLAVASTSSSSTTTAAFREVEVCSGAPLPRLVIGESAFVIPGPPNNLRSRPDLDGRKIGQIPGSASFKVLDGPVCADGYAWWEVKYQGTTGWTAEGEDGTYWLEPSMPAEISSNPRAQQAYQDAERIMNDPDLTESERRDQMRIVQRNAGEEIFATVMRYVPVYDEDAGGFVTFDNYARDMVSDSGRPGADSPFEADPVGGSISMFFDPSTENITNIMGLDSW